MNNSPERILTGIMKGEHILEDDYPIYAGYLYVADGHVIVSDWHDITARQFCNRENVNELRRCNMSARNLF